MLYPDVPNREDFETPQEYVRAMNEFCEDCDSFEEQLKIERKRSKRNAVIALLVFIIFIETWILINN